MISFYPKTLPGDVFDLKIVVNGFTRYFKGLCIGLSNRSMLNRNSSVTMRNYFYKYGLELTFFLHLNIILTYNLYDYQRKRFVYRASKLFYLRNKLNRESLVF